MRSAFTVRAFAKINLGLTVVARRADGFHDLESVMQQVSLSDKLSFEPMTGTGWQFFCTDQRLAGPDNLVSRAAALLEQEAGKTLTGVKITLYKNIPVSAGLAGGSADAAGALAGLNRYWGLKLDKSTLLKLGATLGSDVPFCLQGGTVLARGRGEQLEELPLLPFFWIVLALPHNLKMSTAAAYKYFDTSYIGKPSLDPLVNAVRKGCKRDLQNWLANGFTNTLETAVLPGSGILQNFKLKLQELGFLPALSGSGPTLFIITEDYKLARSAVRAIEQSGGIAYLCWTTAGNEECCDV